MIPSKFRVLPDDVDEFTNQAREMGRYLKALGAMWDRIRNETAISSTTLGITDIHLFEVMPIELVTMLDEVGSKQICEDAGCLQPVHADWDFCYRHGMVHK